MIVSSFSSFHHAHECICSELTTCIMNAYDDISRVIHRVVYLMSLMRSKRMLYYISSMVEIQHMSSDAIDIPLSEKVTH